MRAAAEVAVAGEQLDGFADERSRVGELVSVVGDDPASFEVGLARSGHENEMVFGRVF